MRGQQLVKITGRLASRGRWGGGGVEEEEVLVEGQEVCEELAGQPVDDTDSH